MLSSKSITDFYLGRDQAIYQGQSTEMIVPVELGRSWCFCMIRVHGYNKSVNFTLSERCSNRVWYPISSIPAGRFP
jgi:hypothetical protein